MHGQDKEKMTLSIGTLRKILFSWKMVVNCRETLQALILEINVQS